MGLEPTIYRLEVCRLIHWATGANYMEVPPRFELGFPDSKSDVLTATLWDQFVVRKLFFSAGFEPAQAQCLSDFEFNALTTSL